MLVPYLATYQSQSNWVPYGHLICTPVSLLIGTTYLHGLNIDGFSEECVREIMSISHALYKEQFAQNGQPLSVHELFQFINKESFDFMEAAGTVLSSNGEEVMRGMAAENLVVMSLHELILTLLKSCREMGQRMSLIATANEHTVCYLIEANSTLFVFDPLPASMRSLHDILASDSELTTWLEQKYGSSTENLYSALILKNKHCDS